MLLGRVWAWAMQVQHLGAKFLGEQPGDAKLCLLGVNIPKILEYCSHIQAGSCCIKTTVAQVNKQISLLCCS